MQHLQVIEVCVAELLPISPGEVMWTAFFWTGCVHLLSQSWPLPGQHKQLGHHRQDQIPQLPKLWGKKTAACVVAVQSHYESVIIDFLPLCLSGLLQRISMNESPSSFLCRTRASLFPQQRRHCSLPTQWVGYRKHVLMITLVVRYSTYRQQAYNLKDKLTRWILTWSWETSCLTR